MYPALDVCRQWRHLVLLVALLALLVVHPITSVFGVMEWLFDLLLVVVMAVLLFALTQGTLWRIVAFALCIPAASLSIGGHLLAGANREMCLVTGHALGTLFFFLIAAKIIRSVLLSRDLSWDSIFGAICGYLLLGIAWGLTYAAIQAADKDSFQLGAALEPWMKRPDDARDIFIYYSFVTLTTLGYGDVTPVSITARTASWLEAISGQLYLAILIAGLIGAIVARKTTAMPRE